MNGESTPAAATEIVRCLMPGEAVAYAISGDYDFIVAGGEDTGGTYALMETLIPPMGGPIEHIHTREHEAFYVLEGDVTFQAEGNTRVLGPGCFIHLPIGVPHAFKNLGTKPARMLVLVAPAGLEAMVKECGRRVTDTSVLPPPATHEDIERMLTVAPKYGLQFFPPA